MKFTVANAPRPRPARPADHFNTYAVGMPKTSEREIGCVEADCPDYHAGWYTTCQDSELGRLQADYIRHESGRRWFEGWRPEPGGPLQPGAAPPGQPTVFYFEPGQACFNTHTTRSGPLLLLVRTGDWRPESRQLLRRHTRPDDWVEDCAEAVDRFNNHRKKG